MQQDNTTTAEYTYDANGNLTKDLNKGILSITYNYLNLPASITKTVGTRVEYSYDATGIKRQQRYYLYGTLTKTTDFYTNIVYENYVPAWVTYDEGRVVLNSNGTANINEAYIKDHLGNVRVVYYWAGSLKTQQVNSYYPFGMNIKGLTADGSTPYPTYKKNEYLYNGKMMQDEMGLGWLDYGARFYDAELGRWHSVDLLAEKHPNMSHFNYCLNNPVRMIDPDGKDPREGGRTLNVNGHKFNVLPTASLQSHTSFFSKRINDKAMWEKFDDVAFMSTGASSLISKSEIASTILEKITPGYQAKLDKLDRFLDACVSDKYQLQEIVDNDHFIDREIKNMGKGFESEVSIKTEWQRNSQGDFEVGKITQYEVIKNADYGKKNGLYTNSKNIYRVATYNFEGKEMQKTIEFKPATQRENTNN